MNEITAQDIIDIRPKGAYGEARPFRSLEEFINAGKSLLGEQAARSIEAKRRFLDLLRYPEFHEMVNQERADAIGVSFQTLQKWMIQVPDEYLGDALRVSRERSAKRSLEVDAALMTECRKGNVKAMDLYYRRIEGWVPKQDMELTRGRDKELDGKANFELLKQLFNGLSPAEKTELVGEGGGGAIEGNVERLEGGVSGG
jgi:hypothetical protein